jgi:nucleotide-binding universal stress UspA family protein
MMQGMFSLLIAYDGSECADAALDDLRHAGLPTVVEAVIVTVADVMFPPPEAKVESDELPARVLDVVSHAQARAEQAVIDARAVAAGMAKRIKSDFPGWAVRGEACGDSPAWAISKMAHRYQTDLIIIGAHRHCVMGGRFNLGRIYQPVQQQAPSTVGHARCAEPRPYGPAPHNVG